jgi:two-component system, OmpR family, alkaline phosphatase synthesis response regulator PhoP
MQETNTILVIDDDPNIRELLKVNLMAAGYHVTTAADGREGMDMLRTSRPRLVILDVMMPEIDGWELCKFIKDSHELAPTRVLMLTAKDRDKDRMIGKEILGADEYMTKPFDIDELLDNVRRVING